MLLAIDIGNTNTVFAVYRGDAIAASWRCATAPDRSADEYAAFLHQVFGIEGFSWKSIRAVIIGSVVPAADFHVTKFCAKYLKQKPVFVTSQNAGIKISIDNPEQVGADRLINAVAVRAHYKTPAIVIDFGTATTFDVIGSKGDYRGGAIAPGINLSMEALGRAAAKLPKVGIEKPKNAIGTSTVSAIQSGVYWGYIGLIEGLIDRISKEMKSKPFVIATGGLAPLFSGGTKIIEAVDEELTLKGLLQIHKNIRKKNEK
jgi:type III pantothenate kinase